MEPNETELIEAALKEAPEWIHEIATNIQLIISKTPQKREGVPGYLLQGFNSLDKRGLPRPPLYWRKWIESLYSVKGPGWVDCTVTPIDDSGRQWILIAPDYRHTDLQLEKVARYCKEHNEYPTSTEGVGAILRKLGLIDDTWRDRWADYDETKPVE